MRKIEREMLDALHAGRAWQSGNTRVTARGALNPVFKENYNGHGIYWHGIDKVTKKALYGDGTRILWHGSIKNARAAIDARLAEIAAERARDPVLAHWDSLNGNIRERLRREFLHDSDENGPVWDQYESVADYAYAKRPS